MVRAFIIFLVSSVISGCQTSGYSSFRNDSDFDTALSKLSNAEICENYSLRFPSFVEETKRRGLDCNEKKRNSLQKATSQNLAGIENELYAVKGNCESIPVECLNIGDFRIALSKKIGSIDEQLHFFVSDSQRYECPSGFRIYEEASMIAGDTKVSVCTTADSNVQHQHRNNPLQLRVYAGANCPNKNKHIFSTTKVIACLSYRALTTKIQINSEIKLTDYQSFRKVTFNDSNVTQQTVVAYNSIEDGDAYLSNGKVLISGEWCNVNTSIHSKTKNSHFEVICSSGYLVRGTFTLLGSGEGEIGKGKDSFGNLVQYRLHPSSGEFAISRQDFMDWARANIQRTEPQQTVYNDNKIPIITAKIGRDGKTNTVISGQVTDNVAVAEVTIDGKPVRLGKDGSFTAPFYVPRNGKNIEIVAFDKKGNKATRSLFIERGEVQETTGPVFTSLDPSGKRVKSNKDALALIIGVADYQRTPAKATYADKDAQTFYDYAMLKLGISAGNIKELVNNSASEVDVRLAVKDWITRSTKQGLSDIYIFFAGHGLASQSGEEMYLLPYDGSPRLLEDSAISRDGLFSDIASANPRSVTVFLDTCYSGVTRGTDMLIASRPIAIRASEQSIPDNFTVMTAAAGDQTAKPLEEAKHGMFSYFLMKGMEGKADANSDNQITASELHAYVEQNVVQQSSGSQTPELQGDRDRVLVRFQ